MKKIKSLLFVVIALVLFGSIGLTNVKAAEKVKVYVFEAGGCQYCELQLEYLKGLDSYNEKFEIIEKELYVDHVDWAQGKDFELGKTVAEAFKSAGFEGAAYNGTPFVVISNLYAAASYSTNLESYINEAYEKGDKDVVGCFANGGTNCLEGTETPVDDSKDVSIITTVVLLLFIAGSVALVIYTGKKNAEVNAEEIEEIVEEKPVVKEKKTEKKSNNKKPTKKKK